MESLSIKERKKIYLLKTNQKIIGVSIIMLVKIELRSKRIAGDKEGYLL